MQLTLKKLLKADPAVAENYQTANARWLEFFSAHRDDPIGDWAQWLTKEQISFFEHQCGGRQLGQEIMAWSGFAHLYSASEGFADNLELAKKLADAFSKSMCSIEVKGYARQAAEFYDVNS